MTRARHAVETHGTRGSTKAVVFVRTEWILGAAILDAKGGDVASVLQVAGMGGLPCAAIRDGPFACPTPTESLQDPFMTLET